MVTVVLVIHLLIAIALVATVLLQRSEGGALGIGGGGGGMGGFMTGRATANLLTKTTAALAVCFVATSLILAVMSKGERTTQSILDTPAATAPAQPAAEEPAGSSEPSVPLAK